MIEEDTDINVQFPYTCTCTDMYTEFILLFLIIVKLYILLSIYLLSMCVDIGELQYVWRSEDTLLGLSLFFHHVGSRDRAQAWQQEILPAESSYQPRMESSFFILRLQFCLWAFVIIAPVHYADSVQSWTLCPDSCLSFWLRSTQSSSRVADLFCLALFFPFLFPFSFSFFLLFKDRVFL